MIRQVEELGPKLKVLLFGDGEVLADAKIPLPKAGVPQDIARLSAECACGRLRKCGFVEPRSVIGEGRRLQGWIADQVPKLIAAAGAHPGIVGTLAHGER